MKVNISLNDDLAKRIDSYAKSNYMSRSGLISFATTQYLNQADVVGAIKDMSVCIRKIAETGNVDYDTFEQLKEFERVCKVFSGQS